MIDALRQALERTIDGEVRFDPASRALYSTDASVYQIVPLGVVVPRTEEDLVRIVRVARQHRASITARGGGTSQAGQAVGAGLQVDTSKYLTRILEVDARARWAWVEPGVVLDELNRALQPDRLRFAPDISTANRATIGGMIGNNSSGARSVVYGKTIDHVLELRLVMADGGVVHLRPFAPDEAARACDGGSLLSRCSHVVREIARTHRDEIERRFPKVLRRVGGYNLDEFVDPAKPFNLAKMIVGSEGTLGLVSAAKIGLVPLPEAKAVLAIEFDDLLDALAATRLALTHLPSAIEVMDRFILDHARTSRVLDELRRSVLSGDPGALLCVEFYGDRAESLLPRLEALESDLRASRLRCRWRRAVTAADQTRIWSLREAALGLSMAMKGDAKSLSFVEDTAVAPERLREYIERFLEIIRSHETVAGVYAHASVGCLHVRPVVNLKTADGVRRFESIAGQVADLVLEFGGALSGEHGDGLVRGPFTEKMFGTTLYQAFRTVKRAFDPENLFNPGKIVDAPPLTANLRFGAGYATPDPPTFFDFTEYGGFGRAVEMCSGLGACRKKLDGTMCPSYMATLEEKHSTRGRANTLRLAMAGTLGERVAERDVLDALDLCLECRACKAECPVGVDMARFKSEFLASYWRTNGVPLRARVIGHVNAVSRWGSRLAPVSNGLVRIRPSRWLGEKLLGVDRRRTLPPWSSDTFEKQFARRRLSDRTMARGEGLTADRRVVLFTDTFTNYSHPDIGTAAADILDAAGVGMRLVPHRCCGRPLISQGLLEDAQKLAAANADALHPAAANGERILFFEPSCLSAVREDAPALLRGDARRKADLVAAACDLFEEYLERQLSAGAVALRFDAGPSRVVLHGHCHQKAMGIVAPARSLLSRIPSCTAIELDAGCCGMAGSFGYGREHYEISRTIGEKRLFPAARGLPEGAVLVASGVSCRQQVEHFTGVKAVHPAVLLRDRLTSPSSAAAGARETP